MVMKIRMAIKVRANAREVACGHAGRWSPKHVASGEERKIDPSELGSNAKLSDGITKPLDVQQ